MNMAALSRQKIRFVRAYAPATVANVGPGFDAFGFALEGLGDTVTLERKQAPGAAVVEIRGDGGVLPRDPKKNVASAVVARMLGAAGVKFGVSLILEKGLPLASGLGSSSASAAAAAIAANALLDNRFSSEQLIEFARFGEKIACGMAHADNVAPAILGGFIIVRSTSPLDIIRVAPLPDWHVAVVHPRIPLPTSAARAGLPRVVPFIDAAATAASAGALIAAILAGDLAAAGRALMGDCVVTPYRTRLIPGYGDVVSAALAAGAAGVSISGAGPSIFALTDDAKTGRVVAGMMSAAFLRQGVATDLFTSRFSAGGGRIIEQR